MIFLSHSSEDKPLVRRLAKGLEQAGYTVWLDEWKIRVGECIVTAIEHAITDCRFVILVLSPNSISSGWVNQEWRATYWAEIEDGRIRVLPVLAEKCVVPVLLRTKRYVDLSSDFATGLSSLNSSLSAFIAEDSAKDFYAYAPVIANQLTNEPDVPTRNAHWDNFERRVSRLPQGDRYVVQRRNSLYYLNKWGLTVTQLRMALASLGFKTVNNPDFTPDLAAALENFQRIHCLRHVDGVFGHLTYRQMYDLHRQSEA
jgi:hypothetical protein